MLLKDSTGPVTAVEHVGDTLCVAATFTVEPLMESLQLLFQRVDLDARWHIAPYNQVFQQLLDPGSLLRSNQKGFNFLWLRWDDLVPNRSKRADWLEAARATCREAAGAIVQAASASAIPWIVAVGPGEYEHEELALLDAELSRLVTGTSNVHMLTHSDVDRYYPAGRWTDPEGMRVGHIPYTREAFAAVGAALARRVVTLRSSPRKVIVLDCDNTLWGGVCGEDGSAGVRLDRGHVVLQEFMRRQKESGMLLCLASKNVEEDVFAVFAQRGEMVLSRDDFVTWRIDWSPKAENLEALAAELDLALDSFIFVDDSPVECAEVRARHPQVLTLELPKQSSDFEQFLQHVWAFDKVAVTEADRRRTESYRAAVKRQQAREHSGNLREFIAGLELRIGIDEPAEADVPRVAQLTQRTNQFNSTTLRLNAAEVRQWMVAPERAVRAVKVADRFGDYGLVGLLLCDEESDVLRVRGFMLSCRALGRGVEHAMVARAGELAEARSKPFVAFDFRESARNLPVRQFLDSLGADVGEEGDMSLYRLSADVARRCVFEPPARPVASQPTTESGSNALAWPSPEALVGIATELFSVERILVAIGEAVRPRPDIGQSFVPPRNRRERLMCQIWCEVLALRQVGVLDRFSDLGGSSVQLVRVHGLLVERMGVRVDLTILFQHPTVSELVAALDRDGVGRMGGVSYRAARTRQALQRHRSLHGSRAVKEQARG